MTDIDEEEDEFDREADELPHRRTKVIHGAENVVTVSVAESLYRQQKNDPKLGNVVAMRVAEKKPPSRKKLQTHTGLTKKMVSRWGDLEIYDGLVYRRKKSSHIGEQDFVQLLLPRSQVEKSSTTMPRRNAGRTFQYLEDDGPGPPEILLVNLEGRHILSQTAKTTGY